MATREELKTEISRASEELHGNLHRLERRLGSLVKWMIGLLATIWGTVVVAALAALKLLAGH